MAACIWMFHKYCCYAKRGVLYKVWLNEILGHIIDMVNYHNAGAGAWIMIYYDLRSEKREYTYI